jgi:hypothetical protein
MSKLWGLLQTGSQAWTASVSLFATAAATFSKKSLLGRWKSRWDCINPNFGTQMAPHRRCDGNTVSARTSAAAFHSLKAAFKDWSKKFCKLARGLIGGALELDASLF